MSDLRLGGQDAEFEDYLLLNVKGRAQLLEKYSAAACDKELEFPWKSMRYNRSALMNLLANRLGPECAYLEIGCDDNVLFDAIPLADKTGVDPVKGGNTRMTSDAFFEQNEKQFDLIFLDGLHTYRQLHRDVQNALKVIRPGGFIGIHDLVPLTWQQAHVPRISGSWTGDVWKVGVELALSPEIDFRIVLIDHGVGLIHVPDAPAGDLLDLRAKLDSQTFADFYDLFAELPTMKWKPTMAWLEALGVQNK